MFRWTTQRKCQTSVMNDAARRDANPGDTPLKGAVVDDLNAIFARLAAEPLPVEGGNRKKIMKKKKRSRRQKK